LIRIKEETMGKTINTPGYSLPQMPQQWSENERQYALGVRDNFDQLFSQKERDRKQFEENQTAIDDVRRVQQQYKEDSDYKLNDLEYRLTNVINEGSESVEEQIAEINEEIGTIEGTMADDKEELLGRIASVYNEVYPIGITVLGSSSTDCPITFGTWEADYTDPVTGDPIPDDCGNYRWRRVADPE
jgi:hypothetical protein